MAHDRRDAAPQIPLEAFRLSCVPRAVECFERAAEGVERGGHRRGFLATGEGASRRMGEHH